MKLPDIGKLTLTELKQLQRDLAQAIASYEDRRSTGRAIAAWSR